MILSVRGGSTIHTRAFALTDMVRWGYTGLRSTQFGLAGLKDAQGIPAMHRAARLRAEAVATLDLYCWRGEGPNRERVDAVWQARLFRNGPQANQTNPVQTKFSFWETAEESLAWRNNAYLWKNKYEGKITDWWALHPDQVTAKYNADGSIFYVVEVSPGFVDPVGKGPARYEVPADVILHIRGYGDGGQLVAPTPIQVFRDKLQSTVGRQRHEARMWRRGIAVQQAILFPQGAGREQRDQFKEAYRSNYEGTEGETTVVLGGGAQIQRIGLTPADAQFVEMAHLTQEDAAQIMGVPADLLGVPVGRPRPDLEQDLMEWLRFGLGPELDRIEEALYADPDLFGASLTYPAFDTDEFVRGDILTEATVLATFVQAGVLTPDEARHKLGYGDPLPDGVGRIPQITPVGGAPNPLLALPKPVAGGKKTPAQDANVDRALERRLVALEAALTDAEEASNGYH